MPDVRPLSILLLCDNPPRVADTLLEHINALSRKSRHKVFVANSFGASANTLDFDRFDVIVIHYSLVIANDSYVSPAMRTALRQSRALKAAFIQDEYRHIDQTNAAFREIGLDVLFTCMPTASIESVYSEAALPGVRKINVLTGYVPEKLLSRTIKPYATRPIDVSYRARKVPAWLGDLGQEKWNIGRRFLRDAEHYGLICDIAYREEERLYGDAWVRFLENCKATLGVESGSSVFDFTGEVQAAVNRATAADPDIPYDKLKREHFADIDGVINQRQISPRCFEAAALGTLMILYEGHYSGLLEPWRHYVPLAKDHSNMADVVAVLRDPVRAQAIVDAAYREVALNPDNQFQAHVNLVDRVLSEEHTARGKAIAQPYSASEFEAQLRQPYRVVLRRAMRVAITYGHYLLFRVIFGLLPESRRDVLSRQIGAALLKLNGRIRNLLGILA